MKSVKTDWLGNKTVSPYVDFMRFETGNRKRRDYFPKQARCLLSKRCFTDRKT